MIHVVKKSETREKILTGARNFDVVPGDQEFWKPGSKIDLWENDPLTDRKNAQKIGTGIVLDIDEIVFKPQYNTAVVKDKFTGQWVIASDLNALAAKYGYKSCDDLKKAFPAEFYVRVLYFELQKTE